MSRPVNQCRHCGRGIISDHGFSTLNLDRHENACLDMQARERVKAQRRASRRYRREMRRAASKAAKSMGSVIVPGPGQLGFPFEGVLQEIVG